ncbi:MFS transporter [Oceanobacillus bengalensis]|uniref:MFS transporter n=1 Tax=Oceanobacillus bengalensis TaxID=1435466 RepID=A0A494YZ96_9BACI|nr:MFS transporter [Oceanobacillus bengalensis]RKQ15550.1 MFS transporter [Oceanobacillus bengalensis]
MNEQLKFKKATYHLWTFIVSKFISSFGAQVYAFAASFYILQVTGSATNFALNLLCNVLPRTIAAPFAGYVADRFSRKKVVIISHIATVLTIISLITISLTIGFSITTIYIATAIFSLTSTFSGLAFTSSISGLIDSDRIQKAMSLNQMVVSIASIASPAVGGILYGFVSITVLLAIYLVAMIIALSLESTMQFNLFINLKENVAGKEQGSMWQSMKEGFAYVKGKSVIMAIISIALVINFFVGAFQVGYSFILIDNLHMSSEHFGIVESSFAVGMLIMSVYLSIRKELVYPLVYAKRGILLLGIILAIYSLPLLVKIPYMGMFSFYMILMFLLGAIIMFINTPINVMMQKQIDDAYKGRVFSIMETSAQALIPLGTILFGFLYDTLPAPWIMGISAILLIVSVLYLARPFVLHKAHPEWGERRKNMSGFKQKDTG